MLTDLFIYHHFIFLIIAVILMISGTILIINAQAIDGKLSSLCILFFGLANFTEYIRQSLTIDFTYLLHIWGANLFLLLGIMIALYLQLHYLNITGIKQFKEPIIPLSLIILPFIFYILAQSILLTMHTPIYVREGAWYVSLAFIPHIVTYSSTAFYLLLFFIFAGYGFANAPSPEKKQKFLFDGITLFIAILFFIYSFAAFRNSLPPEPMILLVGIAALVMVLINLYNFDFSPKSAKNYQAFLTLSPQAIIVLDETFEVTEVNQQTLEQFGIEKGTNLKDYPTLFQHPKIEKLLTTGQKQPIKDGLLEITVHHIPKRFSIAASMIELQKNRYYYIVLQDITKEYEQEQYNQHLAFYDALTNMPNRASFNRDIMPLLEQATNEKPGFFLLSDLNHFKQINDKYGHPIGDEVLKHTAQLMVLLAPANSIYARLGGDEFVFFISTLTEEEFLAYLQKMRTTFRKHPFTFQEHTIEVIPSFGYSIANTQHRNYELLYQAADLAMYTDKQHSKITD